MNNKIIKNTIILYIKLIVTTVVGLYSSRFILKALGIDDYGLYVVIGGVVTSKNFHGDNDYVEWLKEIKSRYQAIRNRVVMQSNS